MTQSFDPDMLPQPDDADSDLVELTAALGLSDDEAAAAWNAVLDGLDEADEQQTADLSAQRLDVGDLVDLFDGGKKPDLGEMAKDELVKAVAKKLGMDPAKAGAVVDMILKTLDKPTKKKPRKTTSSTSKPKPKPKPKPAASSTSKPKPKPAASSTSKPKPKPAASSASKPKPKPAASSTSKPKPKPAASSTSKPKPKPKPAASSTSKPKPKKTTRSNEISEE